MESCEQVTWKKGGPTVAHCTLFFPPIEISESLPNFPWLMLILLFYIISSVWKGKFCPARLKSGINERTNGLKTAAVFCRPPFLATSIVICTCHKCSTPVVYSAAIFMQMNSNKGSWHFYSLRWPKVVSGKME